MSDAMQLTRNVYELLGEGNRAFSSYFIQDQCAALSEVLSIEALNYVIVPRTGPYASLCDSLERLPMLRYFCSNFEGLRRDRRLVREKYERDHLCIGATRR